MTIPPKINLIDSVRGPKFKRREIYPQKSLAKSIPSPQKDKKSRKLIVSFILIILVIFIVFSSNIIFSSNSLLNSLADINLENQETSFWGKIKRLVGAEEKLLEGEAENRINVLLLGQGGAGHEGPYLTDTIILVSFKPSTNQVAAISIPRDLYVPVYKNGWRRINFANSFGETDMDSQGGEIASQTISNVFNLPIHYYARVDFEGFKKIVNDLGGVNVYVERDFTDPLYPTSNYGTTTITFEKGWRKMDGETALQFARSRHGNNGEAGDFARSKRQQKIIIAIKNKTFSFGSLLRPDKFIKAAKSFSEHFSTNLKTWEILRLSKFAKTIDLENIITHVLDDSPSGPLEGAITEDGAYVLKTKTDDFSELITIAENIFLEPTEAQVKKVQEDTQELQKLLENIKNEGGHADIIVQNGTLNSGLAKRTADYLASLEFNILKFSNALNQNLEKTIIYDFTNGKKQANLELLQKGLKIEKNKKSDIDDFGNLSTETDFLIIAGYDYVEPIIPQDEFETPITAGVTTTTTSTPLDSPEATPETSNNVDPQTPTSTQE